ncbi:hypothetical protein [Desulfobulbus alkaliphilus]|uniref:hypothetical protein n=1 Tax=Desulfobulbus alkaliphilus TaxID=869814 RepID=UPI001964B037|nr:hypothetical protein [Desulfobulbus alkaliphilus]MBM9535606.1 hypothetical protein [Desulfobulbus alkaliphilus]
MKDLDAPPFGVPGNALAGIGKGPRRDGGEQHPFQGFDTGRRILFTGQNRPQLDRRQIPALDDRLIQQAIAQVLVQIFAAHDAVYQVRQYIREGYLVAVDTDLAKFFDTVEHDVPDAKSEMADALVQSSATPNHSLTAVRLIARGKAKKNISTLRWHQR